MQAKLRTLGRWSAILGLSLVTACSGIDGENHTELGSVTLGGGQAGASLATQEPSSSQETDPKLLAGNLRATGLDLVYFANNSAQLTGEGKATLQGLLQWLRQHQVSAINIEGHADERGTRAYNISLGRRRAMAVRNYLIANGIASNRVRTRSYGNSRPIVSCDDIICWAQNRRVQTVIASVGRKLAYRGN